MGRPPSDDKRRELIGRKVGNHVIVDMLGAGGMGTVYLAEHPTLGTRMAVKVLAPRLQLSEEATRRFMEEARAASRVRHAGVIQIQDFGQLEGGGLYYTMEALEGRGLERVIRERAPFTPAEVLAHLEQLCPALQAAHELGIVHRDLKPANIIVVSEEPLELRVFDFGIAKVLGADGGGQGQTASGLVMGTPEYTAPEQAAGHPEAISPRTDLYSLGIICYEMLSGSLPITADNPATLLHKQVAAPPTPLLELAPGLPPAVSRIVHRCLEKDPAARPADAPEYLELFRAALAPTHPEEGDGPAVSNGAALPAAVAVSRRWLLAVAALALLASGGWLLARGMSGPAPGGEILSAAHPDRGPGLAADSGSPDLSPDVGTRDLGAVHDPDAQPAPSPPRVRRTAGERRRRQPSPSPGPDEPGKAAPVRGSAPAQAEKREDVFREL